MAQFDPAVDYYEILQVHQSAHQEVIKRAYRTIVGLLQAHPDLGGSHEDAVRVNEAYQVLSDPVARKAYDAARKERQTAVRAPRGTTTQAGPRPAANGQSAPRTHAHQPPHPPSAKPSTLKRTVSCPHCGARNRLPLAVALEMAVCGKCGGSLASETRGRRVPTLPAGELSLSHELSRRLDDRGELRLRRAAPPADHHLHCLRCHHEWMESPADPLPAVCPRCNSPRWSDFRLFRCRACAHQFSTDNLHTWAYWLFSECPACHERRWHAGSEKHPLVKLLRWLRWR